MSYFLKCSLNYVFSGVSIGTSLVDMEYNADCIHSLWTQGYAKMSPFFLPKMIINMPAGHVSIKFGLKVRFLMSIKNFNSLSVICQF